MTAGFQSIGDSGNVQIDQTYKNLAMLAKGSIVTDTVRPNASGASQKTFTVSGCVNPMIVVRPVSNYGAGHTVSVASGIGTFRIVMNGPVGQTCDYWIFDEPNGASGGFGLQVFNASGAVTFDSSLKYARVVDFVTVTNAMLGSDITYPSGKTYGVLALSSGTNYQAAGPGAAVTFLYGFKAISNGFNTGAYQTGQWQSSITTSSSGIYLILDVTGY